MYSLEIAREQNRNEKKLQLITIIIFSLEAIMSWLRLIAILPVDQNREDQDRLGAEWEEGGHEIYVRMLL